MCWQAQAKAGRSAVGAVVSRPKAEWSLDVLTARPDLKSAAPGALGTVSYLWGLSLLKHKRETFTHLTHQNASFFSW